MKRKMVLLLLLLCLVGWMIWFWYPILENRTDLVSAILLEKADSSRALTFSNGLPTPAAWIMFVLLISIGITVFGLKVQSGNTHGSARHANRDDTSNYRVRVWPAPKEREQRLLLGHYGSSTISLPQRLQQQNVLLTAMIGSGKTFGLIMRNLLRECGLRSLFISDVKAELVRKTAGYLSRFYEVHVFAPLKARESDGYNPLMHVHSVKDALQLAQCWALNTGDGQGSDANFWMLLVIRAINATILHLRAAEPDAPFSRLADILSQSTYEELRSILIASPSPIALQEARQFFDALDRNDKIVAGLMADLGNRFQLFLDEDVRTTTACNTIDFTAMAERPIALFLSIPPRGAEMCKPLFACFMSHMWSEWELRAEQESNGQLPVKVECYMDEFANLGRIFNFKEHLTTMRHTGVGLIIVLQSFSQIDDLYGQATRNILLTNCGTHLLLPGAGLEETRYYSERIGDTTTHSTSQNTNGGFFNARNQSWTTSETRRRLCTAEELRTMKRNQMLVLGSSMPPIIVETKSYERDRTVRGRADLPFARTGVESMPAIPLSLSDLPTLPAVVDPADQQPQGVEQPEVADDDQSELAPE